MMRTEIFRRSTRVSSRNTLIALGRSSRDKLVAAASADDERKSSWTVKDDDDGNHATPLPLYSTFLVSQLQVVVYAQQPHLWFQPSRPLIIVRMADWTEQQRCSTPLRRYLSGRFPAGILPEPAYIVHRTISTWLV